RHQGSPRRHYLRPSSTRACARSVLERAPSRCGSPVSSLSATVTRRIWAQQPFENPNQALRPDPPPNASSSSFATCPFAVQSGIAPPVHRDVKPANIFLCRYGEDDDFVKLDPILDPSRDGDSSQLSSLLPYDEINVTVEYLEQRQYL